MCTFGGRSEAIIGCAPFNWSSWNSIICFRILSYCIKCDSELALRSSVYCERAANLPEWSLKMFKAILKGFALYFFLSSPWGLPLPSLSCQMPVNALKSGGVKIPFLFWVRILLSEMFYYSAVLSPIPSVLGSTSPAIFEGAAFFHKICYAFTVCAGWEEFSWLAQNLLPIMQFVSIVCLSCCCRHCHWSKDLVSRFKCSETESPPPPFTFILCLSGGGKRRRRQEELCLC